jgi:hypothetical protein
MLFRNGNSLEGNRIETSPANYDLESLRDLLLMHSTSTINSHDLRNVPETGL